MRRVKVPGLDIQIPPGSAFKIETPPMMPKMHLLAAVVAPRGYGKGVITTNLIEQLKVVDRLILVSPSAASNKALNDRLKRILAKEDMLFDNPNDISVLDKIVAIVEKERDDYEEYWEKRRKYELLMKKWTAIRHSSRFRQRSSWPVLMARASNHPSIDGTDAAR